MKVPKELVEQWCGEAYANNIGIQYIAQRAAEWALSQPVSMEPVTDNDLINAGCRYTTELTNPTPQPVSMMPVAEIGVYVDEGGPCLTFIPRWYGHLSNGTHSLFDAAQLAAARQQGAEEERKNANVWVAGIVAQRIAELEQKNAQLLEALKMMGTPSPAVFLPHEIELWQNAIADAEVKP